ncbi:MAG TPA: hypothetical protein VG435_00550, partial [Acidimicrobiales bacterium]|nr:hypothetical protein [Acidimicrobiales bacterium]
MERLDKPVGEIGPVPGHQANLAKLSTAPTGQTLKLGHTSLPTIKTTPFALPNHAHFGCRPPTEALMAPVSAVMAS